MIPERALALSFGRSSTAPVPPFSRSSSVFVLASRKFQARRLVRLREILSLDIIFSSANIFQPHPNRLHLSSSVAT
ncbi:hypothetical protein PsorP6_016046 [Peronosclerospora sorghi]|uniref:Uncharacterized protein n=1 Tax=Peronosclerospora sorghi TaxID=230839 RepID=A0ACC0WQH9_9STRA|nr:hypothetical protein PsorP6_016046 [Peronosclerospora sorghi]